MNYRPRTTRRTNLAPILNGGWSFKNTTGSLQGGSIDAFARDCYGRTEGWLGGDDLTAWRRDRDDILYVVTSYATPIAWRTTNGWHVVDQRFSVTTSRHQSQVRLGLRDITG